MKKVFLTALCLLTALMTVSCNKPDNTPVKGVFNWDAWRNTEIVKSLSEAGINAESIILEYYRPEQIGSIIIKTPDADFSGSGADKFIDIGISASDPETSDKILCAFVNAELLFKERGNIHSYEVTDITGDSKDEIILQKAYYGDMTKRTVQIYSVQGDAFNCIFDEGLKEVYSGKNEYYVNEYSLVENSNGSYDIELYCKLFKNSEGSDISQMTEDETITYTFNGSKYVADKSFNYRKVFE